MSHFLGFLLKKSPLKISQLAILLSASIVFSSSLIAADYVFTNGKVYTVNLEQPWVQAVAVDGNRIIYVGNNAGAEEHITETTQLVDLQGKMLLPGFIDTHMHTGLAALFFNLGISLVGLESLDVYLETIRKYAEQNPDTPVIGGFGFDARFNSVFDDDGPTKELLDSIVSDRPVFIISTYGHSAWANSKALEALNINKDTPDPQEGVHFYKRDKEGNPTGHLMEGAAFWSHLEALGLGTREQFKAAYPGILSQLPESGITSLFDAGIPGVQEYAFKALLELEQDGRLPVRYNASNYVITPEHAVNAVPELERLRQLYTSELVRVAAIKISNDGQGPDNTDHIQFPEEKLTPILSDIARAGADVMVHTTQAETIAQTVNAMEKARTTVGNYDSRFTMTHVPSVLDEDYQRFQSAGIIANIQPLFLSKLNRFTFYMMSMSKGFKWIHDVHMFKNMVDSGAVVTLSSDYPVCSDAVSGCSPLRSIEYAHNRQPAGDEGGWIARPRNQRLSIATLIRAATINGAYQLHMEDKVGSIETGKLADLVVLEENLFEVNRYDIHSTKVLMTMVNGRVVHDQLQ